MRIPFLTFISCLLAFTAKANDSELLLMANKGQVRYLDGKPATEVLFTLSDQKGTVHLRKDGWDYYQYRTLPAEGLDSNRLLAHKTACRFQGTNPSARLEEGPAQQYSERYYKAGQHERVIHAHSLDEYWIRDIYPGIDYHVYIRNNQLKYDFEVQAGADISQIRWEYFGETETVLKDMGGLSIKGAFGEIEEQKPISFKTRDNTPLKSTYREIQKGVFGFYLEDGKTANYPRTIDPFLIWTTYYGGAKQDVFYAVHSLKDNGNFAAGYSGSPANIAFGGYQDTLKGIIDIMVLRTSKTGKRIWASYYGGDYSDVAYGMLFYGESQFYLVGGSQSAGIKTRGTRQPSSSSDYDLLLMKVDSSGQPIWVMFHGGDTTDYANQIRLSSDSQSIYISGSAQGDTVTFNSKGAPSYSSSYYAFIAKLDTAGTMHWSRIFAGNQNSIAPFDMVTLNNGNLVTSLRTYSTNMGTINSFAPNPNSTGSYNNLISTFDSSGKLIWSGYLGGSGHEYDGALAANDEGSIYFAGTTISTTGIAFNPGTRQATNAGNSDIYLSKLDTGGHLFWTCYLGGAGYEQAEVLRQTDKGHIYLAGMGGNPAFFSGSFQDSAYSQDDGILVKLDSAGNVKWGTFFGTDKGDVVHAFSATENKFLVGGIARGNGIFGTKNSIQTSFGGDVSDGFLIMIAERLVYSTGKFDSVYCTGQNFKVPFELSDAMGLTNLVRLQLSNSSGSFSNPQIIQAKGKNTAGRDTLSVTLPSTITTSGNYKLRLITTSPADTFYFSQTVRINQSPSVAINNSGSQQLCPGDTVTLSSPNPSNYRFTWKKDGSPTGDTLASMIANDGGNYSAEIISTEGCTTQSYVYTLAKGIVPEALIYANDTQFCKNNLSLQLRDSSLNGTTRIWTQNGAFADTNFSILIDQLDTGIHTFLLKSMSQHGCADSVFQNIWIHPVPNAVVYVSDSSLCLNEQNFVWTHPSDPDYFFTEYGFGDGQKATGIDTVVHAYAQTGVYSGYFLVKNMFGCSDSVFQKLTVKAIPMAGFSIVESLLCDNVGPFHFQIAGASTAQRWSFGDGDSSLVASPQHSFDAGNYTVELVVENANSCKDTASQPITVHQVEEATIVVSSGMICANDSSLLTSNCAQSTQRWLLNTQLIDTACSVWINDSATYMLIRTDGNGCSDTTSAQIGVYPPVQVPGIVQDWDTLKVAFTYSVYRWYYNGQLLNSQTSNKLLAGQNGNYEVEVEDANGCVARSAIFILSNVGIPYSGNNKGIIVYPNPAYDRLFVAIDEPVLVEVYDMKGNKVIRVDGITFENPVDVQLLAEGYYLVYLPEFNSRSLVYISGN